MSRTAIAIKEADNVATAIRDIPAGSKAVVGVGEQTLEIQVVQDIPYGHKFALRAIAQGQEVLKYNCVIGRATCDIGTGQHAHVHNMESLRGRGDLQRS